MAVGPRQAELYLAWSEIQSDSGWPDRASTEYLMRRLIVTGDDFGVAIPVNEAIELAHRDGILSTVSLMVGADAAADAIARAKRLPQLRVGLHLVLVQERSLLSA